MKARLIKRNGAFYLMLREPTNFPSYRGFNSANGIINEGLYIIATSAPETYNKAFKLSLKNCRSIERGYDLDELAEKCSIDWNGEVMEGSCGIYKEGFQKALELLGNKKFSEEDMISAFHDGWYCKSESKLDGKEHFIQSLQQTEWEVEAVMWLHGTRHKKGEWIPKLDVDNCLMLRKI